MDIFNYWWWRTTSDGFALWDWFTEELVIWVIDKGVGEKFDGGCARGDGFGGVGSNGGKFDCSVVI